MRPLGNTYSLLLVTGKTTQRGVGKIIHLVEILLKFLFTRLRAAQSGETAYHQSQKHSTCIFPTRRVPAFPSFLVTSAPFFPRLRKRRKRRRRECNEPPLVRLLTHSSYLLRAIPYSVDSKEDLISFSFFFVFSPPPHSSIMSLFISPTIVLPSRCSIRRLVLGAPLHAAAIVEKKLQLEQETSIAQPLFPPPKVVSQNESRFLVEGCYAFTRAMKEVSAK